MSSPAAATDPARIIAQIGIPSCPAVLAGLVREARSEEADQGRIAGLISADVALAAAMLRIANSALYSGGAQLASIRQAVLRIGTRNVVDIVTASLLRQAFPAAGSQDMEQFWQRSSQISEWSARIAAHTRVVDTESAFTFGLFRDCGMAVMIQRFPDYGRLLAAAEKMPRRLTDVETARYGVSHVEVGHALAQAWLLNEAMCEAILRHHSPDAQRGGGGSGVDPAATRLIAVAALAEAACLRDAGEPPSAELETATSFSLLQLGLPPDALDSLPD